MSRARNLAGFATAIYPVDNISVGFITCRDINITGVATFQNINIRAVEYADVAGIATYASTAGIATYASTAGIATYASTAGVATVAEGLTGTPDITVGNIVAVGGTFSGDVSVAGTITYQDVTDVDSVGVITARSGIDVVAGGIDVIAGGITVQSGGVFITGVATATAGTLIAGVGIRTEGSVATADGAKSIDFRGSGVTTAIFDTSSGISTVYIEGGSGGGGGGAAAGFVFSYIMGV